MGQEFWTWIPTEPLPFRNLPLLQINLLREDAYACVFWMRSYKCIALALTLRLIYHSTVIYSIL